MKTKTIPVGSGTKIIISSGDERGKLIPVIERSIVKGIPFNCLLTQINLIE